MNLLDHLYFFDHLLVGILHLRVVHFLETPHPLFNLFVDLLLLLRELFELSLQPTQRVVVLINFLLELLS